MADIKVILIYENAHVEELTISEDLTCAWATDKGPGMMKLTERETFVRLLLELTSVLRQSAVKKLEIEEGE